jgi:hypothetical protein
MAVLGLKCVHVIVCAVERKRQNEGAFGDNCIFA